MAVVGMVSAVSLLLRHWRSIEAAAMGLPATGTAKQEMEEALSQQLLAPEVPGPALRLAAVLALYAERRLH